jgi:aromatic-L-amino-acid decarboxylase
MQPNDMPPDEFRRFGHEMVDWIADYLEGTRDYPVMPSIEPGQMTARLPASAPEQGEPMERILADFRDIIVPAVNHWNHPRFHAYFSSTASGPGILGELLAASLNSNGMLWKASPANTELELLVMSWLRQWIGLPETFFGMIHDTASSSTLHAIAAARQMADPETRERGGEPKLTLYCSEFAHSSIEKDAMALGIGQSHVRKIGVDAEFRMRPEELEAAIVRDRAAGLLPFCVVSTAGTTGVTSIDPLRKVQEIAARHRLWHHVDAAFGGTAAIAPQFRWVLDGASEADSLVVNPHKWLFTPSDLSAFYCRRPEALRAAFSLIPEYLRTPEDAKAVNLMDYAIPLGRRFRALKLWFVMRYFGREKISAIITQHIRWAQELAVEIAGHPDFEVVAPVPLSLICFRKRGSDAENRALMDRVNASGVAFLSGNVVKDKFAMRIAVGNLRTTRDDLATVWRKVQELAR